VGMEAREFGLAVVDVVVTDDDPLAVLGLGQEIHAIAFVGVIGPVAIALQ